MRDLDAAISAAVAVPDERGLMPLEQARALVQSAEVFREGHDIRLEDGRPTTEGARLWAALLSLEDAPEFVQHATRIRWLDDVPGPNNTAPLFRYGDDILPWLARFVSPRGWLQNLPNCVGACLMASPTEAVFHLLTPVRGIHHSPEHPEQDPPELAAPGLMDWTARYPRTGLALLVRGARQGDRRLHGLLRDLVARAPGASFQMLSTRFGAQQTQAWFEELELPTDRPSPQLQALVRQAPLSHVPFGPPLTLPILNRAFKEGVRPFWDHAGFFTAAIRVSGFAHPSGDALIFESLVTGLVDDGVRVELHGYGPHFGPRQARYCFDEGRELIADADLSSADGNRLELHTTGVVLQWDGGWQLQHTPWDHPRRSAEISLDGELVELPLDLPAELQGHLGPSEALMWNLPPERAFLSPGALLSRLKLPPDAERLFVFDSFQLPFGEDDAAQSQDLIAMVEALGQRRKLQRLPQAKSRLFHVQDRIHLRGGWGTIAGWGPRELD